jgi:bisphosphoglycerate-independent phosphoglycerate mutase (AlkP superfamily)
MPALCNHRQVPREPAHARRTTRADEHGNTVHVAGQIDETLCIASQGRHIMIQSAQNERHKLYIYCDVMQDGATVVPKGFELIFNTESQPFVLELFTSVVVRHFAPGDRDWIQVAFGATVAT